MNENLLAADLDYIVQHTSDVWHELKGKNIFITGGTGFIGTWLLETFAWANKKLNLDLSVFVLTRNLDNFSKKAPHLINDPAIQFQLGDVRNFQFSEKIFSHIIHGATESSKHLNDNFPHVMLDTILQGTKRTLEFSAQTQAKKFLLLSSGAVYGKQPSDVPHISESHQYVHQNLNSASAYAIGKFTAEHMSLLHANQHNTEIKIARCFAFVGPYLPLDIHFAIGNFIRDGLQEKDIFINSDGSAFRSYQYAADLTIWLLHILCRGQSCVPYNVGSNDPISILNLAKTVTHCFSNKPNIKIAKKPQNLPPERYVPSVQRAQEELGLKNNISLTQAIQKTINWYKNYDKTQ